MVNVTKGVLVECDPAVKQFLLHLDEKMALGKKFVIEDLDETHIFVSAEIVPVLQEKPIPGVKLVNSSKIVPAEQHLKKQGKRRGHRATVHYY